MRFSRLQAWAGSQAVTQWPRAASSRSSPRWKWALRVPAAIVVVVMLGVGLHQSLPLRHHREWGTSIAVVEVVGGACGIAGAALAPRLIDRLPTGRLTLVIVWTMLPLTVPMALWNTPLAVAAGLGAILLLNPAGNAGISSYRMAITPPELLGRVQAAMQFTSMATMPIAPVLAGVLLSRLGGRDAIAALAGLTAVIALIPTLSRSVRSIPRPAQWVVAG